MAKKKVVAKRGTGTIDTTSAAGIAAASNPTATATQQVSPYGTANIGNTPAAMQAALNAAIANPVNSAASQVSQSSGSASIGNTPAAMQAAVSAAAQNNGTTPATTTPAAATGEANALDQWTLEGDPIYQQAMQGGLSAFNTAKAGALFKLNAGQTALENQRKALDQNAWDARRQLAGNYAARGMQRGAYGAFYRAQDKQNAQQVAAQTDIKDQIAALNQDFLTNYGTAGADWTGTATGQDYRQKAIQLALQNRLTQAGVA